MRHIVVDRLGRRLCRDGKFREVVYEDESVRRGVRLKVYSRFSDARNKAHEVVERVRFPVYVIQLLDEVKLAPSGTVERDGHTLHLERIVRAKASMPGVLVYFVLAKAPMF